MIIVDPQGFSLDPNAAREGQKQASRLRFKPSSEGVRLGTVGRAGGRGWILEHPQRCFQNYICHLKTRSARGSAGRVGRSVGLDGRSERSVGRDGRSERSVGTDGTVGTPSEDGLKCIGSSFFFDPLSLHFGPVRSLLRILLSSPWKLHTLRSLEEALYIKNCFQL